MQPAIEPWLNESRHRAVVRRLLEYGLIKTDTAGKLPLKKGGFTDIYINLRQARNSPTALAYLTELFKGAVGRLDINRFVEIPDSVSALAGPLAIATNLPYLTIRGEAKEGRASDARVIGDSVAGDNVVIIDDVITDGASKLEPINVCASRGLNVLGLVVLVDRQEGWQNTFSGAGINTPVWAGMTLEDVRRELIALEIL